MQQFSIKNDHAVELLNDLTKRTGKGKTELVIEALEHYQARLRSDRELEQVLESLRENASALIKPGVRAPTKEEIEEMLGMP